MHGRYNEIDFPVYDTDWGSEDLSPVSGQKSGATAPLLNKGPAFGLWTTMASAVVAQISSGTHIV